MVKSLARLIPFFFFTLVLTFSLTTAFGCLRLWIGAARMIPPLPFSLPEALLNAALVAIPAAFYVTIMLSLGYASRWGFPPALTAAVILVLAPAFTLGLTLAHSRLLLQAEPPSAGGEGLKALGKSGLRLLQGDVSIIVLGDPADGRSPRISAVPGQPLAYLEHPREIGGAAPRLPPAPFRGENSPVMDSLITDLSLASEQIEARRVMGLNPLLLYLFSLALLLVSFYRVFAVSAWPLANMLLGTVLFRALLSFQTYIDSDALQSFIFFFLGRFIPQSVISPGVFALGGILVLLATLINAGRAGRTGRGGRRERHG
ncbi:MAG: hypothetical protein LBQ35_01930 [Spirochaetaceae bacterium]|jgi:hypothetical protein|nr:hypothetical protein [Spirochaetaceae bacterium]